MNNHLKYLTTANWLRGYAEGMEELSTDKNALVQRLLMASDLLLEVWNEKSQQPKQLDGTLYSRGENW